MLRKKYTVCRPDGVVRSETMQLAESVRNVNQSRYRTTRVELNLGKGPHDNSVDVQWAIMLDWTVATNKRREARGNDASGGQSLHLDRRVPLYNTQDDTGQQGNR